MKKEEEGGAQREREREREKTERERDHLHPLSPLEDGIRKQLVRQIAG